MLISNEWLKDYVDAGVKVEDWQQYYPYRVLK